MPLQKKCFPLRKSVYLIFNEDNTKMEQKTIKIADLEVNRGQIDGLPKNPRTIKDARFEALKKSIEDAPEMLALRELLVYPHNGKFVVIGGNMRLKACKDLGYKELPCKVIDENTPVEKLREYTIKDNIGFGADDWGALFEDWNTDELADWGLEFPEDFNVDETQETEIVEDEVPEEVETRCKLGDIWQLEQHRLMCGDSTNAANLVLLMNGEVADITITSPPYNVMSQFANKHIKDKSAYLVNDTYEEYSDDLSDEEYYYFLSKALINSLDNSKDVFFNIGCCKGALYGTAKMIGEFAEYFKGIISWKKSGAFMPFFPAQFGVLGNITEPIYCFSKNKQKKFAEPQWKQGDTVYNLIETQNASGNEYKDINAATFPIELPANVIKLFCKDSVLDLFCGTGTTLIAAEQLNKKCFAMELSYKECDIIIARWEKLTGKTAVKINE